MTPVRKEMLVVRVNNTKFNKIIHSPKLGHTSSVTRITNTILPNLTHVVYLLRDDDKLAVVETVYVINKQELALCLEADSFQEEVYSRIILHAVAAAENLAQ